ncbi:MAG: HNH endonuclease signature motif containing protein [Ilumatobacteraceae bacterium]
MRDRSDDIETRLGVLVGQLNAVHAALVDLVAEAAETGAWQGVGVRSLSHWLTWQAGLSGAHARELERLAAAKVTHPVIMGVFADGRLTVDQALVAVQVPAHNDAEVAELAPLSTVNQIRSIVRMALPPVEPAAPDAAPETLSTWFDRDGRFSMSAELDADHGRIVDAALSAARDRLFREGDPAVSWVDALIDVCERSLDAESPERRDRFRIEMFFDLADPVPARWADGSPVPDSIRQHLTCDGTFTPTFVAEGRPVSVGASVAGIPERTRRLVLRRDQGCRVPWCTRARWLDVHHIVHREHGGATELPNLVALCRRCHRAHHRGELGIVGNADVPDGLTFTDPDGRRLGGAPHVTPPDGPPPDPAHPYEHPLGERLHRRWLFLSDPPEDPPEDPPGTAA